MTDILPGQLIYIFAVSVLDAALLSWLALLWYRRSVRRLMREGDAGTTAPVAEPSRQPVHQSPATEAVPSGLSLAEEQAGSTTRTPFGRPGWGRVVLAYSLGAAAYAAVITTLKFSPASPPLPRRVACRLVGEHLADCADARRIARPRSAEERAARVAISGRRRGRRSRCSRPLAKSSKEP